MSYRVYTRAGRSWIDFRGPDGVRHRFAGLPTRKASEEFARRLEELAALTVAGSRPTPELEKWLASLPPDRLEQLQKFGLIDTAKVAGAVGIETLIADWGRAMEHKGNVSAYIGDQTRTVARIAKECHFRALTDFAPGAVRTWLSKQKSTGLSARRLNGFLLAAKNFLNWAVREGLAVENPLRVLQGQNERLDRRRIRRALTSDEIGLLLAAAEAGPKHHGLTGHKRRLIYSLALCTGLRWSEIKTLHRGDFALTTSPAITIRAGCAKNRTEATLPLRHDLAAMLAEYFSANPALPGAPAFPGMWKRRGADMLAEDLAAAGLEVVNSEGEVLDFHATRHSYCTGLAKSGVAPAVAMRLARHSDVNLTLAKYSHISLESGAEAVEMLPAVALPAARQTGTDDTPENAADTNRDSDSCARGCAFLGRFDRNSSDEVGKSSMRVASGPESKNALWHNEKAHNQGGYGPGKVERAKGVEPSALSLGSYDSKTVNTIPDKPLTVNPKSACARICASPSSEHENNSPDADALAGHADPSADADFSRLKDLWPTLSATARQTLAALAGQLAAPVKAD